MTIYEAEAQDVMFRHLLGAGGEGRQEYDLCKKHHTEPCIVCTNFLNSYCTPVDGRLSKGCQDCQPKTVSVTIYLEINMDAESEEAWDLLGDADCERDARVWRYLEPWLNPSYKHTEKQQDRRRSVELVGLEVEQVD